MVVMPPRPAIEIVLAVIDATVPRRDLPLPANAGPAREAVTASVAATGMSSRFMQLMLAAAGGFDPPPSAGLPERSLDRRATQGYQGFRAF